MKKDYPEDRTIAVTGRAALKAKPDTAVLSADLCGTEKEYSDAVSRAVNKLRKFKKAMKDCGIRESDIRTSSLSISPVYDTKTDESGRTSREFRGYSYSHSVEVEVGLDDKVLGDAVQAMAEYDIDSDLRISYKLKDVSIYKNQLIEAAIAEAISKATLICSSLKVVLGPVINIEYSFNDDISLYDAGVMKPKMASAMLMEKASLDDMINPQDIELRDSISIEWEIE
ncbi:MAG: SIMPL domain-containing protein [Oscillospiraceae bacterium]|jgi:uncharacterized protein YggE